MNVDRKEWWKLWHFNNCKTVYYEIPFYFYANFHKYEKEKDTLVINLTSSDSQSFQQLYLKPQHSIITQHRALTIYMDSKCSNHVKMFHICCCLEAKNQVACCSVTLSTTIHNNVLCSTAIAWSIHRCTKIISAKYKVFF